MAQRAPLARLFAMPVWLQSVAVYSSCSKQTFRRSVPMFPPLVPHSPPFPSLPFQLLCTTPSEAFDLIALAMALLVSVAGLVGNLWTLVKDHSSPQHARGAVLFIVLAQTTLAVVLKLWFFMHVSE